MAEKTLKSLTFPGLPDTYTIPEGGSSITVDSALSSTSENPVQNKAIYAALEGKADAADIPTVPVASVNGQTGAVELDADDVGAIASDQGVANAGKFLVVGSDGIVAPVTMQTWQGGSY